MKNVTKGLVGEGRDFERIRRITGYLTGTLDGWNSAKRAEERGRVKHPVNTFWPSGSTTRSHQRAYLQTMGRALSRAGSSPCVGARI